MMARDEPDQREIIGYSIDDPGKKGEWISLVSDIAGLMEDAGYSILYHGTSTKRLPAIMREGLRPSEVDLAVATGMGSGLGSFWGDVHTAAAYAEDTARERDGSTPALIAIHAEDLLCDCALHPDLATLDFPLKGLTRLSEPGVYDRWIECFRVMSWQNALEDLGAVVATHDFLIPAKRLVAVDKVERVREMMEVNSGQVPSL